MSVAQAMEFYGPVREILRTKLKDVVAAKAKAAIEKELGFRSPGTQERQFGDILGAAFGDNQFENIVRFMSGRSPSECPPAEVDQPGTEKCIALVYEGVDAVRKIRDVLGPTDPSKAPPGSIRREFGSNHHGQRRPRQRFGRKRPARNGHRQRRRKQLPPGRRTVLRKIIVGQVSPPASPKRRSSLLFGPSACVQEVHTGCTSDAREMHNLRKRVHPVCIRLYTTLGWPWQGSERGRCQGRALGAPTRPSVGRQRLTWMKRAE